MAMLDQVDRSKDHYLFADNLGGKVKCRILIGAPKEIVAFRIMRLFDYENITFCVFNDAESIITSQLVKQHIIQPLSDKKCRFVAVTSIKVQLPQTGF